MKSLPHDKELEASVLGAILIDSDAIHEVANLLKPDVFYAKEHKLIYEAIKNLLVKGTPVDILTVTSELRAMGKLKDAGDAHYVTKLMSRSSGSVNIEIHTLMIFEKYLKRELIRISAEINSEGFNESLDVFELLDSSAQKISEISESIHAKKTQDMAELGIIALKRLEAARQKSDGLTGVTTGFPNLDNKLQGWQPETLVIKAARPGAGKTASALQDALSAAEAGVPVSIMSVEMSANELMNRMCCNVKEIDNERMKRPKELTEWELKRIREGFDYLATLPIYIDDDAVTLFDIQVKARKLKRQKNIGLLIVDYLQIIHSGAKYAGNREQEISYISRSFKTLAKELKIPVILLSQLSRKCEERSDKRPMLSDLRESGAIEQDADVVIFIYRPEMYEDDPRDKDMNSLLGITEIIVGKHRNGELGTTKLRHKLQHFRYYYEG